MSLYSLHTVPDLPRFLAEVQRVLKPGRPFIFLQAGDDSTNANFAAAATEAAILGVR